MSSDREEAQRKAESELLGVLDRVSVASEIDFESIGRAVMAHVLKRDSASGNRQTRGTVG